MKKIILAAILLCSASAYAVDMASIVKAQVILGQVGQVVDKYKEVQALLDAGTITLDYEEPIQGNTGKFLLPFDEGGNPTAWADKALNAQVGAMAAEKASDSAINAAAARVPFGGLLAGAAKSKAKGAGAIMAIGGWDYIKETSSLSFDRLDDYSIYLHSEFNGLPDYEKALAAAMAVYPKLEKSHKQYINKAYRDARKKARKLEKQNKS
jgi:hypothetical protein